MCRTIIINKNKIIETPQEFKEYFGFEAIKEDYYKTVDMNCCLCQVDIEKSFTENKIDFTTNGIEYYIIDFIIKKYK